MLLLRLCPLGANVVATTREKNGDGLVEKKLSVYCRLEWATEYVCLADLLLTVMVVGIVSVHRKSR